MFYSSTGNEKGMKELVNNTINNGKLNVAFEAAYLLGDA